MCMFTGNQTHRRISPSAVIILSKTQKMAMSNSAETMFLNNTVKVGCPEFSSRSQPLRHAVFLCMSHGCLAAI